MRIQASESLLVVVDIQERLFPYIAENERMLAKCQMLIKGLKILGIPMEFTEHYPRGLGKTVPAISEAMGDSKAIEKTSFSCYGESKFVMSVEEHYRKFIILCGLESHVNIMQTSIDVIEAGHTAVVVTDAISSRHLYDKQIAVKRMEKEGVVLTTVESLLSELLKDSSDDRFRAIAKLVR